jgi:hypothetical protein
MGFSGNSMVLSVSSIAKIGNFGLSQHEHHHQKPVYGEAKGATAISPQVTQIIRKTKTTDYRHPLVVRSAISVSFVNDSAFNH